MIISESSFSDTQKIKKAIDQAIIIIRRNIIKFQDCFPAEYTLNGIYKYSYGNEQSLYCHGFWCGIIWLLYEITGDVKVRCYGEKLTLSIRNILGKSGFSYSDHGFLVIPSCIAEYQFTKNSLAKETAIAAADSLLTKYNRTSSIICSFDNELEENWISCKTSNLLNIQLLFYAWQLTGNSKYHEVAQQNMDLIINHNICEDGKTYFRSYFDKGTGKFMSHSLTYAPFLDDGTETRSYAWVLYGLAVIYSATKDAVYKEKFDKVFQYLICHADPDDIYFRDLNACAETACVHEQEAKRLANVRFTQDPDKQFPDSTSTVIIAGALVQMLKNKEIVSQAYQKTASRLLNILIDRFAVNPDTNHEGLLTGGYMLGVPLTAATSTLCGDYFYFELLLNSCFSRDSFWYQDKSIDF